MTNEQKLKRKRWSLTEEELLYKLYDKKMTIKDMADFFPDKTEKQVRAKYDYEFKGKKIHTQSAKKWTREEEKILAENYNIKWSELKKLLPDRSDCSLKHAIHRRGYVRTKSKITKEIEQEILARIGKESVSNIADSLRLSKQSIYNVLKDNNKKSRQFAWVLKDASEVKQGSDMSVTFTIKKELVGDYID